MRKLIYATGGLAVVAASFLGTLWAMDLIWGPPCPAGAVELRPPFKASAGAGFVKSGLSETGDAVGAFNRSRMVLCEGNSQLGPAHSAHVDIISKGEGRFSHWGTDLIFSTSDNSDPNKNGRVYSIFIP